MDSLRVLHLSVQIGAAQCVMCGLYSLRLRPHSWPARLKFFTLQDAADAVRSSDEGQQLLGVRHLSAAVGHNGDTATEVQSLAGVSESVIELARQTTNTQLKVSH